MRLTRTSAQVLRILTIAGFVAAGLLLWRLVDRDPGPRVVESGEGHLSVQDAIAYSRGEPLTVRGYVFHGAGWDVLRLCNGRQRTDPPTCRGPFLYIEGVDRGSFHLESGRTVDGPVWWSPDPVTLVGTLDGTELRVDYIL